MRLAPRKPPASGGRGAALDSPPMRIDLLGPVPPPYGGVSVHLERLVRVLQEHGDLPSVVAPQRGTERHVLIAWRRILREAGAPLLHSHVNSYEDKILLGLVASRSRRVVLTVHGASLEDQYRKGSRFRRRLLKRALLRTDGVIAVSEPIQSFLLDEVRVPGERVRMIPAFLPPDRKSAEESPGPDVEAFLAGRSPVLCANAFHLGLYDGAPLYGADLLLEVLDASRSSHPDLGVVLYVSTMPSGTAEQLALLHERAERLGVSTRFLVVTGSRPFNPLLVRSAALLRPTTPDGDAVSIREALWFGVPVVASDVVARPKGTVLFRSRDADDLWRVTRRLLDNPGEGRKAVAEFPRAHGFDAIRRLYAELLGA